MLIPWSEEMLSLKIKIKFIHCALKGWYNYKRYENYMHLLINQRDIHKYTEYVKINNDIGNKIININ